MVTTARRIQLLAVVLVVTIARRIRLLTVVSTSIHRGSVPANRLSSRFRRLERGCGHDWPRLAAPQNRLLAKNEWHWAEALVDTTVRAECVWQW